MCLVKYCSRLKCTIFSFPTGQNIAMSMVSYVWCKSDRQVHVFKCCTERQLSLEDRTYYLHVTTSQVNVVWACYKKVWEWLGKNIFRLLGRRRFSTYFFTHTHSKEMFIVNGKSHCCNDTFTDVRFTSLLAKNI